MDPNTNSSRPKKGRVLPLAASIAALGLFAAACSSGGGEMVTSPEAPSEAEVDSANADSDNAPASESGSETEGEESAAPAVASDAYPAVTVKMLPDGEEVELASIVDNELPTLLWFWAPF